MSEPMFQVLLIDDDGDDLEIMSASLALQGIRTKCFDSGEKALSYLKLIEDVTDRPVLIILDYNMPKVNGQETLVLLKNNKDIKDIPVVMYSTSISTVLKKNFLDLGAYGSFIKPHSYRGIQVQTGIFKDLVHSFTNDKIVA